MIFCCTSEMLETAPLQRPLADTNPEILRLHTDDSERRCSSKPTQTSLSNRSESSSQLGSTKPTAISWSMVTAPVVAAPCGTHTEPKKFTAGKPGPNKGKWVFARSRSLARFAGRVLRPCRDQPVGRLHLLPSDENSIILFTEWDNCTRRDKRVGAHLDSGSHPSSQPLRFTASSWLNCISTMTDKSQQPKGQDGALSTLNVAIDGLNLAKEVVSITPAKAVIGSVAILLAMIRVRPLLFCDEIFQVYTSPGHDG